MQGMAERGTGSRRGRGALRRWRCVGVLAAASVLCVVGGCGGTGSSYSNYGYGSYDAYSGTRTRSGGAEEGILYGVAAIYFAIVDAFSG